MKRTVIYVAMLTGAAAAYGHAGTVTAGIGKTYGDLQSTLLSTMPEPMPLFLIGGSLMGIGLIGRRRPHAEIS